MSIHMEDCDIVKYEEKEMSETRSWDGYIRDTGDKDCLPVVVQNRNIDYDIPVRVVSWPEGAPKQEDVPQAGERVLYEPQDRICIVVNGIPVANRTNDHWEIRVVDERGIIFYVDPYRLEEIPPTPPQTYTEDEIREAVKKEIDLGTHYEDLVIKRLQEKP